MHLLHLHKGIHHTKKHIHFFHTKYNVSTFTLALLIIFAIEMHLIYFLGMIGESGVATVVDLSFAGSAIPAPVSYIWNVILGLS